MRKRVAIAERFGEETPFARFKRNMRALMAVPKTELDAKIEQARRLRQQRRRAAAKG